MKTKIRTSSNHPSGRQAVATLLLTLVCVLATGLHAATIPVTSMPGLGCFQEILSSLGCLNSACNDIQLSAAKKRFRRRISKAQSRGSEFEAVRIHRRPTAIHQVIHFG